MNATLLESQITAALSGRRAPLDRSRNGAEASQKDNRATWATDYGNRSETTAKAALAASRLPPDWSGGDHSSSSDIRENRMGNSDKRPNPSLWRQVMLSICPGTRNFIMLTSFAVVLFAT